MTESKFRVGYYVGHGRDRRKRLLDTLYTEAEAKKQVAMARFAESKPNMRGRIADSGWFYEPAETQIPK